MRLLQQLLSFVLICLQSRHVVGKYLEPRDMDQTGWDSVVWFKDCIPMDKRMETANIFQTNNFRLQIVTCLRGCQLPAGGCAHMTQGCGDEDGCVPKTGMDCDCLDCMMWCFMYGNYGHSCMNDYQMDLCRQAKQLNECKNTICDSAFASGPSRALLLATSVLAGFLALAQLH